MHYQTGPHSVVQETGKTGKKKLYPQVRISRWTKIYNTVLILLHFRVVHTWTPGGVPCHQQDTGKTQPARVGSA